MVCDKCKGQLKAIETRSWKLNSVRRRKECLKCGERYTTIELIVYPKKEKKVLVK